MSAARCWGWWLAAEVLGEVDVGDVAADAYGYSYAELGEAAVEDVFAVAFAFHPLFYGVGGHAVVGVVVGFDNLVPVTGVALYALAVEAGDHGDVFSGHAGRTVAGRCDSVVGVCAVKDAFGFMVEVVAACHIAAVGGGGCGEVGVVFEGAEAGADAFGIGKVEDEFGEHLVIEGLGEDGLVGGGGLGGVGVGGVGVAGGVGFGF